MQKGQAAIDQLQAENDRLHAENRILKRELERWRGSTIMAGTRRCADCSGNYPDSPAFFGMTFSDPDKSKCAACSRAFTHDAGLPHSRRGCPRCVSAKGVMSSNGQA